MAVNLPDTPDDIGATWTNPETGVDYEWDGERWAVVNLQSDFDDIAYLSQNQKFTGDIIFEGDNKFKLKHSATTPLSVESSSSFATVFQVKGYVSDSSIDNRREVAYINARGDIGAVRDVKAERQMESPVYIATEAAILADNQLTTKKFVEDYVADEINSLPTVDDSNYAKLDATEQTFTGKQIITGQIDLTNASTFTYNPVPRSWFSSILKSSGSQFARIEIDDATNGSSDPAIILHASAINRTLFRITDSNQQTWMGINPTGNTAYIGTSSNPYIATSPHQIATKALVDASLAQPDYQGALFSTKLWKFKGFAGSDTAYQSLRQGEFMVQTKSSSGEYAWNMGINVKDVDGRYWYTYNKGTSSSHSGVVNMMAIQDYAGTTRWGGKQESLHFNEHSGVGAYLRVDGKYWKTSYTSSLTINNWYIIQLPGLLPHHSYPLDLQQNGPTLFEATEDSTETLSEANGGGEQ